MRTPALKTFGMPPHQKLIKGPEPRKLIAYPEKKMITAP